MNLLSLKAKFYALGVGIVTVIGFFFRLQYLKNKNERLKRKADTLHARAIQAKNFRKRDKEIAEEFRSRETDLVKELERHSEEEFEGLDNLTKPNDNW